MAFDIWVIFATDEWLKLQISLRVFNFTITGENTTRFRNTYLTQRLISGFKHYLN